MSGDQVEFGFVAALEREVKGLVRDWDVRKVGAPLGPRTIYRTGKAALICAGTGSRRAEVAARLLVETTSPKVLISIGFAGACAAGLAAGSIVVPAAVEAFAGGETGRSFRCAFGRGKLVTLDRVAGKGLKQCAAARFGAEAVDMEAAGVGAVAAEFGVEFVAIKAISDGAEDDLGFLAEFVRPEGFATGRFLAHIALRPGLWPEVRSLQRNSGLAAEALARAVAGFIADRDGFAARYAEAGLTKESY
jgi:adenosylhomocysteine nucleosidase